MVGKEVLDRGERVELAEESVAREQARACTAKRRMKGNGKEPGRCLTRGQRAGRRPGSWSLWAQVVAGGAAGVVVGFLAAFFFLPPAAGFGCAPRGPRRRAAHPLPRNPEKGMTGFRPGFRLTPRRAG